MIKERFYLFVLHIKNISKYIEKLKFEFAPQLGVKNVHIFWLYELYTHPEGLTASELASRAMISRSLISREIEDLLKKEYIQMQTDASGKPLSYNSHITLTEKGVALAKSISKKGLEVQSRVNEGISDEELVIFYGTLEKLYRHRLAEHGEVIDKKAKRRYILRRISRAVGRKRPLHGSSFPAVREQGERVFYDGVGILLASQVCAARIRKAFCVFVLVILITITSARLLIVM